MMAAAPASTDWGLLGVSLAVALPALPAAVRLGLQNATSCNSPWDNLVQAIFLAETAAAVETVRVTLAAHLAPAVAVPAWVALAVAGSALPPSRAVCAPLSPFVLASLPPPRPRHAVP